MLRLQEEIFTDPASPLHRDSLQRRHYGCTCRKRSTIICDSAFAYVWIINPRLRKGYVATKAGMVEAQSGILETTDPDIRVPIAELFDVD